MEAFFVIFHSIFIGCVFIFTYVTAYQNTFIFFQTLHSNFYSAVIKPHSVNNSGIFLKAKKSFLWISNLRFWRDGSYLNKTKPEVIELVINFSIFVQIGR